MKQKFKFLSLLCALMLMCTGQAMAYDDWKQPATNNSDFRSTTWTVNAKAGQYIVFDYEVSDDISNGNYFYFYMYYMRSEYGWYNNTNTIEAYNISTSIKNSYVFKCDYAITDFYIGGYSNTGGRLSVKNIRVVDSAPKMTSIELSDMTCGIKSTYNITVKSAPNGIDKSQFIWTSSNTSIATVDNKGQVTGVKAGTATITATAKDGSGVSGSCTVTVVATESITLQDRYVGIGNYSYISRTVLPSGASTSLAWTSSDPTIATVDNDGYVTGVKAGTVTITATAKDGTGVSGTCTVKVMANCEFAAGFNVPGIHLNSIEQEGWDSNYYGSNYMHCTTDNVFIRYNFDVDIYTEINYGFSSYNLQDFGYRVKLNGIDINESTLRLSKGNYTLEYIVDYLSFEEDQPEYYVELYQNIYKTVKEIDTIEVKRVGTLGGEALRIRKNLKDFNAICVIGELDEYDWKSIDEMGLTYLDLTDAKDKAYPSTVSNDIRVVKMSKYITEIKHNPFPYIASMYVPKEVTKFSATKFTSNYSFVLEGCDGVISIPAHAFDNSNIASVSFASLKEVPEYAFYHCKYLAEVNLPEVTKIGDYAFEANCSSNGDGGYYPLSYYYGSSNSLQSLSAPKLEEVGIHAFNCQNKMVNAETLKLRKIGEYAFDYCENLGNVDLSEAKTVPNYAFYNCKKLKVPSMESLESIGKWAFYECYGLKEAIIPNVTNVSEYAFFYCNGLTALDARRATTIGSSAFNSCQNLKTANLSKAETISDNAFKYCSSLQEINLPEVSSLGAQAFYGCSSATSINMSDKLTQIGNQSFYGCTAAEQITLPASLMHLPSQCFSGSTNIKVINCNAPAPPTVGDVPFYMQTVYTATLRVPESSLKLYQSDFYWKHFYYMETNPDEVTDLTIRTEIPYGENRFDKINLTIAVGGALEMSGTKSQAFRSVTFEADKNGAGALLSNTQRINSDATKVALNMEGLKWYFFTLPFDAQITDIDNTNDAQLAIYSYDGAHRAQYGTGGNWTRHTSGTLTANKGYIVQASKATDITFKATYETKNTPFVQGDKTIALDANTSSTASNKGWNYIGNPYAAYYDISYMDFTAPITVWNGTTYQAYSVDDDEFALKPLQSFFVQCPTNVTAIAFDKDGRQMNSTVQRASAAKGIVKSQRKVIDIVLSDDANSDRTRIVVNGDATDDYDMNCDAAKMMSMDETVPQLYTERDGEQYAINEGPQSTGIVDLGLYIPTAGRYTIKATRSDISAYVVDALTGKRELLTKGMTFEAEQGVMAGRMSIELADDEDVTAVDAAVADAEGQEIYDLGGKKLDGKQSGINIIRRGADVKKSVVR